MITDNYDELFDFFDFDFNSSSFADENLNDNNSFQTLKVTDKIHLTAYNENSSKRRKFDDCDNDTSEYVSTDLSLTATTESPKSKIQKITIPRLLKQDIRRLYSQMFTNMLNSGDVTIVKNFARQFFVNKTANINIKSFTDCYISNK
jgi:hypothetical protein